MAKKRDRRKKKGRSKWSPSQTYSVIDTSQIVAMSLGLYAAIIGAKHGVFEILQGNIQTKSLLIQAVGPSCQHETVWHACLPALTLLPDFFLAGLLTVTIASLMALAALFVVPRKRSGLVLTAFSVAMLLVGGGFVPTFIGLMAAFASSQSQRPFAWIQRLFSNSFGRILGKSWLWWIGFLIAWLPGAWILGLHFNLLMLKLGVLLFFVCDLGVPFLAMLAGIARDANEL